MKSILKQTTLNMIAIFLVSSILTGLSFQNDIQVLVYSAIVLSLANTFIKPFLKVMLLPINVITLGLTGWLVNTIILFIVTLIVPGFQVQPFQLQLFGTNFIFSQVLAIVVISIILSISINIINWIFD